MIVPLLCALMGQELGRSTVIPAPKGIETRDAMLVDCDGDGRSDLVVVQFEKGARVTRRFTVHLRRTEGAPFPSTADHQVELTRDVTAIAVADVHSDPGPELVLFSANGAFAWRARAAEGEPSVVRLVEAPFLWQLADVNDVIFWQEGVRDFDRDGLADLLLPGPSGYRIVLQRRDDSGEASFELAGLLELPAEAGDRARLSLGGEGPRERRRIGAPPPGQMESSAFTLSNGTGKPDFGPGPLLFVSDRLPAPHVADWDGDGDLDVIAEGEERLSVWLQDAGRFATAPEITLPLPVAGERAMLDVSYSSHARDLDGDARVDCVVFAGDKRSKDARTQVLVFNQSEGTLFGDEGLPQQLLVLAGIAGSPRFADVDGDSSVDLVVGSIRPDLIDAVRSASSKRLDLELYVFRNLGGTFTKRPLLSTELSMPIDMDGYVARFLGDVTGDGVSELIVRDAEEHLEVLLTRRGRDDRYTVLEQPLFELSLDDGADLRFPARESWAGSTPEFIVVELERIVHVSFP